MFPISSCSSVLIALVASLAPEGPLTTTLVARDPASGELQPLAGVKLAFVELAPKAHPGGRVAWGPAQIATSNERGECAFTSDFGFEKWSDTEGSLLAFKPGYVPCRVDVTGCGVTKIELAQGKSAHTRLCLPPGAKIASTLECKVLFPLPASVAHCRLGAVQIHLDWRLHPDGMARAEFDLSGFERGDSKALVFIAGYDTIEIGPSQRDEFVLRPERCQELRVCDWESGAPIDGVQAILRFGVLEEDGRFRPNAPHRLDHYIAVTERNEGLAKLSLNTQALCSTSVLLPGESAAQLTNLRHADYLPTIYLAKGGERSRTPLTLLGPDAKGGVCTLYLQRKD